VRFRWIKIPLFLSIVFLYTHLCLSDNISRREAIRNTLDYYEECLKKDQLYMQLALNEEESLELKAKKGVEASIYESIKRERVREESKHVEKCSSGSKFPLKLSGEYRIGLGFDSESGLIWKDANSDKQGVPAEKNWRFLWGDEKYNTFDKKIYSRLQLDLETQFDSPWRIYTQIVIDPWTFVGVAKVKAARVRSVGINNNFVFAHSPPADYVDMELKYWAGTSRTIDEVYRSYAGLIVNVGEMKANSGQLPEGWAVGGVPEEWWPGAFFRPEFYVPSSDIEFRYRPVRQMFIEYEGDVLNLRLFPIAYDDQAYTSDDPLRLCNNHVWWEESPWLDKYSPSVVFNRNMGPITEGKWIRRFSFIARDSDLRRLTFLRGMSFNLTTSSRHTLQYTVAVPMSLWDEYLHMDTIEHALRDKYQITPDLTLGFLNTVKLGFHDQSLEGENYVEGIDLEYRWKDITLKTEIAQSFSRFKDEKNTRKFRGNAYYLGLKFPKGRFYWARMDEGFYPGLSNYRYTRQDLFFSRHIHFEKISPENEAIRIGDSIDKGRYVFGFRYNDKFFGDRMDLLFDVRNAHQTHTNKYIETISRLETTVNFTPKITMKTLCWYQDLPKTCAGFDPLMYVKTSYMLTDYFSDDDSLIRNPDVEDAKDPSIGHFSVGFQFDITDWFTFIPIYEKTNDPGNFPRGLLNTSWYQDTFKNGAWYDEMVPTLYSQGFFDLPPYDYYSIVRLKGIFRPLDNLKIKLSYTKNSNKYEAGLDDTMNHIGLEVNYTLNKWDFVFSYIYSKMIDLYQQVNNRGLHYDGHHNFFLGMRYNINDDEFLDILFGEYVAYQHPYGGEWSLSCLDTQHLLRLVYKRKF